MKYLSFLFAIVFFTVCGCKQEPAAEEGKSEREILFKEVMRIHDAVMPKMADLNRTKRGLKAFLTKDSIMTDSLKTIIEMKMLELKTAEEAMNTWMRNFKSPKSADPDEQVIEYLKKEKVKVSEVSDLMLESLENGNELLNSLQKNN